MEPTRKEIAGNALETRKNGLLKASPAEEGAAVRLNPACTYQALENLFPAVAALRGMDQKTPFHTLTADMHTQEVARNLAKQPVFNELSLDERGLATLAAYLHDIGKGNPEGRQECEGGRVMYVGHEAAGARLAREEVLPHMELDGARLDFVLAVVGGHGIPLRLIEVFQNNDQPKGSQLAAYEEFVASVDRMQGSETAEGRMRNLRLMLAFCRSDIGATVSEETAPSNSELVSRIEQDTATLERLESALPAIIEALTQKKKGRQQAGIALEDGKYRYNDFDARIAYDTKAISQALRGMGIHPKALGILQKTPEADLQTALGNAGFDAVQSGQIIELAARHRL